MESGEGFVEKGSTEVSAEADSVTFAFWQQIKDYMQTNQLECCLTVKDWIFEQQGDTFTGRIVFSEHAESLTSLLRRMKSNSEKWDFFSMLDLTLQIVSLCALMESMIQDFKISPEHIFVTANNCAKMCLFTTAAASCAKVIEDIADVGFKTQDSELAAKLVSEMHAKADAVPTPELYSWLKTERAAAMHSTVDKLNVAVMGKMNIEEVRLLLTTALQHPLVGEYSFTKKCGFCEKILTGDSDTQKYCSQHFACNQCFDEQGVERCPKCPKKRVVLKEKPSVKVKKVQLQVSEEDEGMPRGREFVCSECKQRVMVKGAREAILLSYCFDHGFCRQECFEAFRHKYFFEDFSLHSCCLECMKYEQQLASKRPSELERFLGPIQELKALLLEGHGTPEICIDLLNAFHEMQFIFQQKLELDTPWPSALSTAKLNSFTYPLRCLVCNKNIFVHKRMVREMKLWTNRPFLLRCELKLHAVCSESCYVTLAESPHCPECPQSVLFHSLVKTQDSFHIPTLEALRRTPSIACDHIDPAIDTYPLLTCAHEMCKECIVRWLVDSHFEEMVCRICGGTSEKEALLNRVLG